MSLYGVEGFSKTFVETNFFMILLSVWSREAAKKGSIVLFVEKYTRNSFKMEATCLKKCNFTGIIASVWYFTSFIGFINLWSATLTKP